MKKYNGSEADEQITVFKANWEDFLKWSGKEQDGFKDLEELGDALDRYLADVLRIKTKYVN